MRRREFLSRSILGVGSVVLGTQLGCTERDETKVTKNFEPYDTIELGKTGIKTTRVGFGTGMRGHMRQTNQTRLGKEKFERLILDSYERGVRLFDVADLYGSHEYVGRTLKNVKRDSYVINTKIWWREGGIPEEERPDADVVVERFLKELQTDYLDIVLLHCVSKPDWPDVLDKQMGILSGLKKKGVIRAHGVSCHSLESLKVAADEDWVDSVNARINAYGVKMDAGPEEVAPVLAKFHQAGKAVVGMKLIGEGTFRDSDEKRDKSVSYVLGLGTVDAMVIGFEKAEEIDDFAARVRKVPRNVGSVLV
jgi:aryl-alcohol dehydrogenase-like predicted oxidoreductase